jgi:molybdopterin-guanine dinucleotide biosynthesis protein A
MTAPLKGLLLSGGRSTRMQQDKAVLAYAGETQLERAMRLLQSRLADVRVSVRADQAAEPTRARYPQVVDAGDVQGPIAGIRAAQAADQDAAWLVLACDLPMLDAATLDALIAARDPSRVATAFRSSHDGLPEPLCAIYEPGSREPLDAFLATGRNCPRKFLINSDTLLLDQPNPQALDNVNTPDEFKATAAQLAQPAGARRLRVQYFALLREQARCGDETVETTAATPRDLYVELTARHGFTLPTDMLKVAVNAEFADWSRPLAADDTIVFIPPVAGG